MSSRKLKQVLRLLVVLVLAALTAGCWDRREVNDLAFVLGNAFDKNGDQYEESVQFPLPNMLAGGMGSGGGGGGGGGGQQPWLVLSAKGETIMEASRELQRSMSRILNYSHRRVLLVGEELARDNIAPVLDVISRMPENRLTSLIMLTEGPAVEVLKSQSKAENFPAEQIREIVSNVMKRPETVNNVLNALMQRGCDIIMPVVGVETATGQPLIKGVGVGIFSDDKLVDILKVPDSVGALIATNRTSDPIITVEGENGRGISLSLVETQAKYDIGFDGLRPRVTVRVDAKGFVGENQSADSINSAEMIRDIERKTEEELLSMVDKAIGRMQKGKSDVMGIGLQISRQRPKLWRQIELDWDELYADLEIETEVRFQLVSSGSLIRSIEGVDVDDKNVGCVRLARGCGGVGQPSGQPVHDPQR